MQPGQRMYNRQRRVMLVIVLISSAFFLPTIDAWQGNGLFRMSSNPIHRIRRIHQATRFRLSPIKVSRVEEEDTEKTAPSDTLSPEQAKRLERENDLLRATVRRLEAENERLQQYSVGNRIILESFEGEGRLRQPEGGVFSDVPVTLSSDEMTAEELWCDSLDDGSCPVEPAIGFGAALRDRAYWLVGLLVMQSGSGLILARNEALLANHPVIIYFLTMLVGAGGNAGNQASVRVIRGLALGTLNESTQGQFLQREVKMASALSAILGMTGFLRAIAFSTPLVESIAVTIALVLIVFSSVCLGAVLPLGLQKIGVDPAHSSTTIQVIMDILGVFLAVAVSSMVLDSALGGWLVSLLAGKAA